MQGWVAGARPRTLPASLVPVVVGTACAAGEGDVIAWRAVAAGIVALALQIGTNYANDYSDGVRGTDTVRVGPVRLVASGLAAASAVKRAALAAVGVAAVAGLALAAATSWWLVAVGAVAIASGWLYTGGPRPYGYAGLGELFVFLFFGLVAVNGSYYVQLERLDWLPFGLSVAVGCLATAILVVNNVRDIETDRRADKRTLAVRLGRDGARRLYLALIALAYIALLVTLAANGGPWWALLGLLSVPMAIKPTRAVMTRTDGPALNGALAGTGALLGAFSLAVSAGLLIAS
jgi:1,4-dihydroxy-2-naphthoate polyprenyltransferase